MGQQVRERSDGMYAWKVVAVHSLIEFEVE